MKNVMPLEDCLSAAAECGAPMVSICGGEPLIYPQIEALVQGLREQGQIVYICTNAMFMRRKMRDYLAVEYKKRSAEIEPLLSKLLDEHLVTPSEADQIRKGPKDESKPVISPSKWMYWNVHLDGLEKIHDIIVEREGVFRRLAHTSVSMVGSIERYTELVEQTVPAMKAIYDAQGPDRPARRRAIIARTMLRDGTEFGLA